MKKERKKTHTQMDIQKKAMKDESKRMKISDPTRFNLLCAATRDREHFASSDFSHGNATFSIRFYFGFFFLSFLRSRCAIFQSIVNDFPNCLSGGGPLPGMCCMRARVINTRQIQQKIEAVKIALKIDVGRYRDSIDIPIWQKRSSDTIKFGHFQQSIPLGISVLF